MRALGLPGSFRPPAPVVPWLPRPTAQAALAGAWGAGVRLVAAVGPPGVGKSSAVAAHLAGLKLPHLWLNLPPFAWDPGLFLALVLEGLGQSFPGFAPGWGAWAEEGGASRPALAGALLEAIAELAPEGFVLVLDAADQSPQNSWRVPLQLALEALPERAQLIFLSDDELALTLLPSGVEAAVVGPPAWALGPSERAAMAAEGPAEWAEAPDVYTWAHGRWAQAQACPPEGPYPAPWHQALPAAAALPWVAPALWEAAAEPLAPWPSGAWPPGLVRLAGEAPCYLLHPRLRQAAPPLPPSEAEAVARRLGVHLASSHPLLAVLAFLQAGDLPQAQALAAPLGEALLAGSHGLALTELLEAFPSDFLAQSPPLLALRGDALRVAGLSGPALLAYEDAEWRARARGDARWQGRALVGQAVVWAMRGDERAYKLAMQAREVLPEADAAGRAQAYNLLGITHLTANEVALALTYLEESARLFALAGDALGQGKVLINQGLAHAKLGRFTKAKACYQEAIRAAEAAHRLPMPMVYQNLARVHLLRGEVKPAWEAAERALSLANQLGNRREAAHAVRSLGELATLRGDGAKALVHFEAARADSAELGDAIAQSNALAGLAELAMRQGAWAKARSLLDEAIALRGLPLSDPAAFHLAEVAARLHLGLGETEQAEELLHPLERYMERHGFRYFQAAVAYLRARLAKARGDGAEAHRHLMAAHKLADEHDFAHLKAVESRAFESSVVAAPANEEEALPPELVVRAFGGFELRRGPDAEPIVLSKKLQQLLVYLLLNRRGLSREDIARRFGSGAEGKGSAALMLVSRLRQALEPDLEAHAPSRFIRLAEGRYAFNFGLNYAFDAEEFLALCQQAREPEARKEDHLAALKRALDLYRGALLPTCDEEWAVIERERFRLLANEAYRRLFDAFMARSDFKETLRLADQAIKQDFLNEEAHRTKLIALARQGRREEALRHHKRTVEHFQRRFGVAPGPELLSTFQQILRGRIAEEASR